MGFGFGLVVLKRASVTHMSSDKDSTLRLGLGFEDRIPGAFTW